jgi:hypothetical protein
MKRGLALLALALLSGCSIRTTVKPVEPGRISHLCIQTNKAVIIKDFLPAMEQQIQAHGIQTTRHDLPPPPECVHRLEYTANRRWDFVNYLAYAEINVFEKAEKIGEAIYSTKWGGLNLRKFGDTADKLRPLIDHLFGGQSKD